ncbi:MAG: hypothetical protein H6806_07560 [Planctomycetes bacterium]|nr:hypothetical protein [Planctomycetota bacterium]
MSDTARAPAASGSGRAIALGLFLMSGAVGLAYEVVWSRLLLLELGSTAASSSLVLGLFVAGLGLGARLAGRRAAPLARPLRLYAAAEAGAAIWALLALVLVPGLEGPYVALARGLGPFGAAFGRLLLAAIVVLPGATLLGMTLPAGVASWGAKRGEGAQGTANFYGITIVGCGASALRFRRWLAVGGHWRQRHAAGGRGSRSAVGCCCRGASRRASSWRPCVFGGDSRHWCGGGPAAPTTSGFSRRGAWGLAALLGALGLGIEIAGFRVLVFFVEGFTASLASMLAMFVLGLGAGSLVLGPRLSRAKDPARALGVLLLGEVVALLLAAFVVVPHLDAWLDAVRAGAYADVRTAIDAAAASGWTALAGSAALLVLPAFLLGPTFPLAVSLVERSGLPPARAVGSTYLANAFGSVVGPLLITFVVIPHLGVAGAAFLLVAVAGALAAGLMLRRQLRRLAPIGALAVAVLAVFVVPAESTTRSLLATTHVVRAKEDGGQRAVLAVATDDVTTASVIETGEGERILYTDDFAAAATGRHYRYMRLLGILPILEARRAENVMVIAFGTGTTAGAVASFDDPKRIDVVEVSGAVLDLAPWFADVHRGVLDDSRVRVHRADGRQALLLADADLDVITLEPLMPYSPAGLPLYTQEVYELARDRLRDGGVLCQWVPVHAMPAPLYVAFVRTFFEVFPEGELWFFEQSTALVARKGDGPTPEVREQRRRQALPDLIAAGVDRPERLAIARIASGREVLDAPVPPPLGPLDAKRLVRDRDPYPELVPTPRARLRTPYLAATLEYLATLVQVPEDDTADDPAERIRRGTREMLVARYAQAQADLLAPVGSAPVSAQALEERVRLLSRAAEGYARALSVAPGEPVLLTRRARVLRELALLRAGDVEAAARGGDEALGGLELRMLAAALPPQLEDADASASLRGPTIRRLVAALLVRGRHATARRVMANQLERWPAPEGRADAERERLVRVAAALDAPPAEGTTWSEHVVEDLGYRGARGPQADGIDLLAAERERALHASETARGPALRRLADRATSLLLVDELLAWLQGAEASAQLPAPWRDALAERVRVGQAPLGDRLAAADPGDRARWIEAYDALDLIARHPGDVAAYLESAEADVRRVAVVALGRAGRRPDLARLADRLLDDDVDVRRAAAAALFPHAQDLVETYDPLAPDDQRTRVADAVRTRFSPR